MIISGLVGLTVYLIDSHKLIDLTGNSGESSSVDQEPALDFSTHKDESSRYLNNEGEFREGKDPEGPEQGTTNSEGQKVKTEPEILPELVIDGYSNEGEEIEEVKLGGGLFGQAHFNEEYDDHHLHHHHHYEGENEEEEEMADHPNHSHSRRRFRNR